MSKEIDIPEQAFVGAVQETVVRRNQGLAKAADRLKDKTEIFETINSFIEWRISEQGYESMGPLTRSHLQLMASGYQSAKEEVERVNRLMEVCSDMDLGAKQLHKVVETLIQTQEGSSVLDEVLGVYAHRLANQQILNEAQKTHTDILPEVSAVSDSKIIEPETLNDRAPEDEVVTPDRPFIISAYKDMVEVFQDEKLLEDEQFVREIFSALDIVYAAAYEDKNLVPTDRTNILHRIDEIYLTLSASEFRSAFEVDPHSNNAAAARIISLILRHSINTWLDPKEAQISEITDRVLKDKNKNVKSLLAETVESYYQQLQQERSGIIFEEEDLRLPLSNNELIERIVHEHEMLMTTTEEYGWPMTIDIMAENLGIDPRQLRKMRRQGFLPATSSNKRAKTKEPLPRKYTQREAVLARIIFQVFPGGVPHEERENVLQFMKNYQSVYSEAKRIFLQKRYK